MTPYKQALQDAMTELGKDDKVRFCGYGIIFDKGANGTIRDMRPEQLIETTTTENLLMGMAVGLSLCGLRPVVYIERMDFLPLALCPLINQLDSIGPLSRGQYRPATIIRVMVGSSDTPPFVALTHSRNLVESIRCMVRFPVLEATEAAQIMPMYKDALSALIHQHRSTMIVDFRRLM